ncbi:hypothetical protein AMJ49_06125 [Parcubacteria bacterium DG_74_2]|nr:MAG: hypothetical protein AMJ49_06125 [Parcubacteria bacterium DG_74_2]
MPKDYKELFTNLESKEPPVGLFDRIILAIKREQELRHAKRLLFGFLSLSLISLVATPISGVMFINQIENSGIIHFISTAISDFGIFLTMWQDFSLAIIESLPLMDMIVFLLSLGISIFTLRLFLYKKRLLLNYLTQNFA